LPLRVGDFEVFEELGRGGMGIVYRARDLKLQRQVALKRPLEKHLDRPGFDRRFLNEARAASNLMHPNIVTVFEVLQHDGVPWMAMEIVEGASLRSLMSRGRALPLEDTLRYVEGLTDALRAAHLNQILHRDVNPSNILIGRDGRARLSDFGLAHAIVGENAPKGSQETTVEAAPQKGAGTKGYMSPEQVLGKPLDVRSDLFSLGVVFYEMCTGHAAFGDSRSGEWLDALLNREPKPVSDYNPEIPRDCQAIITKALSKRRFQRYQSATEMLLDIRAVRRKLESETGPISSPIARYGGSRRWWKVAAVGGSCTLLAAIGWWLGPWGFRQSSGPPQLRPHQVTTHPGWEGEPAISPDGSMVAYVSDEDGGLDIWVTDVGGGGSLRLTDHPGADRDPTWFPDGAQIVFVSDRNGVPSLWKVPRLGGEAVMLVENALNPAVSGDGQRIAFTTPGADCKLRIAVASLNNSESVQVLTEANQGYWDHENPAWSPDGETLCFSDFRDLFLVPSDGSLPPTRLTTAHAMDRNPVWSPDGQWIYFSSARESTDALWRVRPSDGATERVTLGTGPEREPSLTADGRRLAYSTYSADWDIKLVDRATGDSTTIPGDRVDDSPAIAPDGSHLVFVSNRSGSYDLWRQQLQGHKLIGPATRFTDLDGDIATPTYSRDGRWLAFFWVLKQQRDIWILDAGGGVPHQITSEPAFDIHPSFSPDGTELVYISERGGQQGIWVVPVADGRRSGEPFKVDVTGGECAVFPRWSPDGRRIAYISKNEAWIGEVDDPSAARPVTVGARAMGVAWESDGMSLLVSGTWGGDRVGLRRLELATGRTEELQPSIEFGNSEVYGQFDTSADGRIIAHLGNTRRGNIWVADLDF
jgi:Tol biopolymer transport system component/serine/threonine protein kinase